MAEGDIFEVLGRVEVDLNALRLSLASAEAEIQASADRQKKSYEDAADSAVVANRRVGKAQGDLFQPGGGFPAQGDLFQPGAGGEGEKKTPSEIANDVSTVTGSLQAAAIMGKRAGTEMSHLMRTLTMMSAGPLQQLNPQLAMLSASLGHATRSMRFYGVGVGSAIAGVVLLTQIMGKYFAAAEKATTITFESGRALATLDASRVESQIKTIVDDVSKLNLQLDQLSGKEEATVWQKIKAAVGVVTEDITGSIAQSIKQLQSLVDIRLKINEQLDVKKAAIDARKAEIEITESMTRRAIANSIAVEDVAKGYNTLVQAVRDKNVETGKEIELAEKARISFIKDAQAKVFEHEARVADEELQAKLKQAVGRQQAFEEASREGQILNADEPEEIAKFVAAARKQRDTAIEEAKGRVKGVGELERIATESIRDKKIAAEKQASEEIKKRIDEGISAIRKTADEEAASAERIVAAQERIQQSHRDFLGIAETEGAMRGRLHAERERALSPLAAEEKAIWQVHAARKADLETLIQKNEEADKFNRTALAGVKEKGRPEDAEDIKAYETAIEELGSRRKELAKELIEIDASTNLKIAKLGRERYEKQIDLEAKAVQTTREGARARIQEQERVHAHAVAMGRKTLSEDIAVSIAAARDPRRSVAEREKAEEDALSKRKSAQEQYYRYAEALGMNTWREQIKGAETFAASVAQGSKEWFEQVQKIRGVYDQIRDAARSTLDFIIGAAGAEDRRSGKTRTAAQLAKEAERRQQRDQELLGKFQTGKGIDTGLLTGALGRMAGFEDFKKQFGGSFTQVISDAFRPVENKMQESFQNIATSSVMFSNTLENAITNAAETGIASFAALGEAIAAAAAAWAAGGGGAGAGGGGNSGSKVVDPAMSAALGRALLLEQRRGIGIAAAQESAGL